MDTTNGYNILFINLSNKDTLTSNESKFDSVYSAVVIWVNLEFSNFKNFVVPFAKTFQRVVWRIPKTNFGKFEETSWNIVTSNPQSFLSDNNRRAKVTRNI